MNNVISLQDVKDKKPQRLDPQEALIKHFADLKANLDFDYEQLALRYQRASKAIAMSSIIALAHSQGDYIVIEQYVRGHISNTTDPYAVCELARGLFSIRKPLGITYTALLEHLDFVCGPLPVSEAKQLLQGLVGEYKDQGTKKLYDEWDFLSRVDKFFDMN